MFYFEGFKPMEEIPKYTYMADALLACLKSTGVEDYSVPAKVMSYLAAGRPILLSMSGEAGLIIRKAKCGYVSGAEDPQGLFDNIMKLYHSSPEKRSEMGRNAFEYQQTYFERNKNIDRMLDVIFGEPEVYSDNRIRLSAEELSDETETEETYAATEDTPAPAASVLFYDAAEAADEPASEERAAEGNVFEEPAAADTEGDDTHEPV
ncbi:MAG: hypothetical protein HUJ75_05425, partial [Parasporobacterium sp.]|nr:hypothetical protein [Parasporobacterium sp.]